MSISSTAQTRELLAALSATRMQVRAIESWLKKSHGLSLAELHVLSALPGPGAGTGPGHRQLARETGITVSGVSRLVDRLEERALVTRSCDGWDRRVMRLALTPAGSNICADALPAVAEGLGTGCSRYSDALARATARSLRQPALP